MGSQLIARLRDLFVTPARQAYLFAVLGAVGLMLGGAGIILAMGGGGDRNDPAAPAPTATAQPARSPSPTPTRTPTRTPSPTPSPSPTSTATAQPTRAPIVVPTSIPTATPTPEPPTPTPTTAVVAGGPYCPSISATAPPNTVGGTVTLAGVAAPSGTVVSLAFDGVVGPSTTVTLDTIDGSLRAGYAIRYSGSTTECANRVGAVISVVVNGKYYAAGRQVGDGGDPFIRLDIND